MKNCSTLTHESVRANHISILSDIDKDVLYSTAQTEEVRQLKRLTGRNGEKEQNQILIDGRNGTGCFDEAYEDFSDLLTSAYNAVIPVRTVKIRNRQKHPCWWN